MSRAAGGQPKREREPQQAGRDLILTGYRGSGKSCVGRLVSARLGWEFIDTDELVERAAGRAIADIFAAEGEPAFRALEDRAVAQAVAGAQRVISVGGGAVLSGRNRERLRAAGLCVWLSAPPEELHRRLRADPRSGSRRPALSDTPGLEEVRRVLAARRRLYAALADHVVETAGRSVEEVAQAVVALVSVDGPAGES